jgi:hypothetical protein
MTALSMVVAKLIYPELQLEYSSLVDGNIANGWLLTTLLFQYVYTSLSKSEVEISEVCTEYTLVSLVTHKPRSYLWLKSLRVYS